MALITDWQETPPEQFTVVDKNYLKRGADTATDHTALLEACRPFLSR